MNTGLNPPRDDPHRVDHRLGHVVVGVGPGVDHLVVPLAEGDLAGVVGPLEPLDPGVGLGEQLRLLGRDLEVLDADGDAAHGGEAEAEVLEPVEERDRVGQARAPVALQHQLREVLLLHQVVAEAELGHHPPRQDAVEQHPAHRGPEPARRAPSSRLRAAGRTRSGWPCGSRRSPLSSAISISARLPKYLASFQSRALVSSVFPAPAAPQLLLEARRQLGEEVAAQHHVLRRLGHRTAVRRLEDVVRRDHQQARLELRLERQRHVHRHLVAVEVGVERRADQRVDPDGLALDQHRLERLDAQAVQRRRAVEQHRVVLDDLFQDLVHLGALALHDLLGALDRLGDALLHQLVDDERLEQLDRHRLGQAALVQPQLRADHDDRAAGVVHALAEQVLAEPALLALEHVGQALERALAAAADRLGAAAVVEQRVHRLLEHPLLVPEDDLRRLVLDQLGEPVVPVDHPAIQVVQVGRGEAPAVERHQRPQVGRNHRDHVQDHPGRVVGQVARVARAAGTRPRS